jgi:hypothetical protein
MDVSFSCPNQSCLVLYEDLLVTEENYGSLVVSLISGRGIKVLFCNKRTAECAS